ncbi:MAG: VanZ family protein [Parvibaculum sp.]|uniref:VanZ family protein n=1 Tax=Parvibaculum sp. TaxID=2024848 RepID=UPI0027248ACC|nr:VanZ family protein [Parvibaculum sp.]MDO8838143.1 VanZ family protein [Parvibaculum sp.]
MSDPHSLRRIRMLLALVWLALGLAVLAGSLIPDLGPSSLKIPLPHADKLVHFLAWALLAGFAPPLLVRVASRAAAASGLFLLSGAIELVQAFLPTRSASFGDLAANGLGIAVGTIAGVLVAMLLARRSRPVATGLAFDAGDGLFAPGKAR